MKKKEKENQHIRSKAWKKSQISGMNAHFSLIGPDFYNLKC